MSTFSIGLDGISLNGIEEIPMSNLVLIIIAILVGVIIWKLPDILKQWRKLK